MTDHRAPSSAAPTPPPSAERWRGGTAVVTGAGRGLGAGFARAAASFGMRVVLADIDADALGEVAAELVAQGTDALAVPTDVTRAEAVDALADRAFESFSDIRLVVNNAGMERVSTLWDGPPSDFHRLMDLNLGGVFHGIRSFVPRLIEAGGEATIVNVSSIAAVTSGAYQGAYQVSKRAVLALTECLISDLAAVRATNIGVSVAMPSGIATGIFDRIETPDASAEKMRQVLEHYVTNAGVDPDVAAAMLLGQAAAGHRWLTTSPEDAHTFARAQAEALGQMATAFASLEAAG